MTSYEHEKEGGEVVPELRLRVLRKKCRQQKGRER
ncbi:hypothetical protein SLEP1_g43975 [Rubroshorea leprosula]|uniref:Uncharacterized protein n=1 Tax=Rubroshorea leprosula TaxID=152421 RepID=A0AAV5LES5_9ROSI|nr:hypothetical protein SLEP1_g43975 [Rubroshorea leprosula]